MPARRSVLESPEIMGLVLEYCNGETLRQISMVNRFFDAASAQKLYRKVNLDASGWYLKDGRNRVNHGTSTPRQAEYLSHARAFVIAPEIYPEATNYDLSACSFTRVQAVDLDPLLVRYSDMDAAFYYDEDSDHEDEYEETRYEENQKLLEVIAKFMARIPDLRPSTVLDVSGLSLPAARLNPTMRPPSVSEGGSNITRPHVTRLVSTWQTFYDSLAPQMEVPAAERRSQLRAVYPDLAEVVLHLFQEGLDLSLLKKTLLFLVEEGYKVVLAGYQEQNHDWDSVRETPLAETPIHIPIPNHD
jgi:hypothetical protein